MALFGGPAVPPMPSMMAPPPTREDPAVAEAARKEAAINAGLMGRGATLLYGSAQPDPSRRSGSALLGASGTLGSA